VGRDLTRRSHDTPDRVIERDECGETAMQWPEITIHEDRHAPGRVTLAQNSHDPE